MSRARSPWTMANSSSHVASTHTAGDRDQDTLHLHLSPTNQRSLRAGERAHLLFTKQANLRRTARHLGGGALQHPVGPPHIGTRATGFTPFCLLFGDEAMSPEEANNLSLQVQMEADPNQEAVSKDLLEEARTKVVEILKCCHQKTTAWCDKKTKRHTFPNALPSSSGGAGRKNWGTSKASGRARTSQLPEAGWEATTSPRQKATPTPTPGTLTSTCVTTHE